MNLVFDLDDTLYDLSEPFRRSHKDLFVEKLGEDCDELFRMSRIYSDEILALEKAGKIPKEDSFYHRIHRTYQDVGLDLDRETVDLFEEKYRYYQKHITVPNKIKEILDYCVEAGHRMAVLSNGNVKNQGSKIDALGILKWFDQEKIFISEVTGYHKPSLGAFRYVEEHLGCQAEQIWYIGDTYEADVLGGKRAGWNVIWYNHRHREVPEEGNVADITVNTAEEVLEVIKKLEYEEKMTGDKTMSTYSIIFSPTGGTKRVADLFANAFAEEYEVIDLTDPMSDFGEYCFGEEDSCIVSVPSFGGRVPAKAAERMGKLRGNGAKAILIVVYGNREFEDTLAEMQDIMEAAGFVPVAAVAALAEHSIVRTFAAGRPDENDAKVLADFAVKVREKIETGCDVAEGCVDSKAGKLQVPGNRPYKQVGAFPSRPKLTEACVKCGICVKACPVQAIPEDLSISMDEEKCISCMRCGTVCPVNARKVAQPVIDFLNEKLSVGAKGYKENQLFL